MARQAVKDQSGRKVKVKVSRLLETLIKNREGHIQQYNEAVAGYKGELLERVKAGFDKAEKEMRETFAEVLCKCEKITEEDISKQPEGFNILNGVYIEMPVPQSFANEYDLAIDIMKWETNEEIELSAAEFQCFVRDKWDWKDEFLGVSAMYMSKAG